MVTYMGYRGYNYKRMMSKIEQMEDREEK